MTKRQAKYIARLQRRLDNLKTRIKRGTCKVLEEEIAEVKALEWAIEKLIAFCESGNAGPFYMKDINGKFCKRIKG